MLYEQIHASKYCFFLGLSITTYHAKSWFVQESNFLDIKIFFSFKLSSFSLQTLKNQSVPIVILFLLSSSFLKLQP